MQADSITSSIRIWESNIMRLPLSLSLAKTATFAVVHFSVAFSVAYLLTGSAAIASALALIEPMANTVAYLVHERAWDRFMPRLKVAPRQTVRQRIAEKSC